MTELTLTSNYTPFIKPLKALYKEAFPQAERKPFFVITHGVKKGVARILVLQKAGEFAGFMVAWAGQAQNSAVLLDYFAVSPAMQGGGIGSRALELLAVEYPQRALVIEIERADDEAAPNLEQRKRRRGFYLRAGFVPAGFYVNLFGVEMETLTLNGLVTAPEYRALYETVMGRGLTKRHVHILQ